MVDNNDRPSGKASRAQALDELGKELSRLLAEARAFATETAARFDPPLSPTGFQIIQWLHGAGATRSMQIAEGLTMDRSALSRALKHLAESGLVASHADPTDARATVYALTTLARSRMSDALIGKGIRYNERLAAWPTTDISLLADMLRRLNRNPPEQADHL